jgi:hypothetical protein
VGWDINFHRMDFDRFRRLQGCKDQRLLKHLVSNYASDEDDPFDADDEMEEEEPSLSVEQALQNILFNTVAADSTPDSAYGVAVGIMYEAASAEYVGDLRVASFGITSFFQEVDAALAARGFPGYLSQLVLGGSPLAIPLDFDGALGFLTPAECDRFAREYSQHDWSNTPGPLRETVEDLWKWCSNAAKHGHGLVAIGG